MAVGVTWTPAIAYLYSSCQQSPCKKWEQRRLIKSATSTEHSPQTITNKQIWTHAIWHPSTHRGSTCSCIGQSSWQQGPWHKWVYLETSHILCWENTTHNHRIQVMGRGYPLVYSCIAYPGLCSLTKWLSGDHCSKCLPTKKKDLLPGIYRQCALYHRGVAPAAMPATGWCQGKTERHFWGSGSSSHLMRVLFS